MRSIWRSSKLPGPFMRAISRDRTAIVLSVLVSQALAVGWTQITTTALWWFVGYSVSYVIALCVIGWMLLGYEGRRTTWRTHRGETPSNRNGSRPEECSRGYWAWGCGCSLCYLEAQTIEGEDKSG